MAHQQNKISQDYDEEAGNGYHHGSPDVKSTSLGQCFESSPFEGEPVPAQEKTSTSCGPLAVKRPHITLLRKVLAEMISTYILIFAGCGSVMVNAKNDGVITHLGISLVWGMTVMILIYSVGHISGAHMNPAVTIAFATVRHFPWCQVPLYIGAQCISSICAAFSLRLIFGNVGGIGVSVPSGSDGQSFALEVILTFILMFVVAAVSTDTRAVGELAGIAVGSAVALNVIFGGPISAASMNPARTIGPAIAANNYRSIWLYMIAPVLGALSGAWSYTLIRGSDPTPAELVELKSKKSLRR